MAKEEPLEKIEPKAAKPAAEPQVTIGMSELMAMFKSVMESTQQRATQTTEDAFQKLADAIAKSREPYVNPKDEETNARMRDQMREQQKRIAKSILFSQQNCPHMQGSNELSDFQGSLTSIMWHNTDVGVWFGICSNCLREFWPNQSDYNFWFAKKCGNRRSMAGQRWFPDPHAAAATLIPETAKDYKTIKV